MKVFGLQEKNTNFVAEILAGLTTFVTMSYLPMQCSQIMATSGIGQSAAYIAICLSSFAGCLIMGFIANQPFILCPSIGMVTFFTSALLVDMKYTYEQALLITLLAGIIFLILSVTGLQNALSNSLPQNMKNGISAGLGIYIALLGFRNAGFITTTDNGSWTLVDFSQQSVELFTTAVLFIGIILISMFKKFGFPFPILLGVLASGGIYYMWGISSGRVNISDLNPDFGSTGAQFSEWISSSLFKNFTSGITGLFGSLEFNVKTILTLLLIIMVCSLFNSVESTGVIYATARNAGKLDEGGNFGDLKKTLMANSIGTIAGSCLGSPSLTVAPESNAGISAEGKSGLTAVTAGVLFLIAALFAPFVNIVSGVITAAAMVYIGILMTSAVKDINFDNAGESIPAFITIILIPFTSSVIDGIALGIIVHIALNLLTFNFKSIKILELIAGALFAASYFFI